MNATLPTLYQYEACPFCWKVRSLLAYKKIDYRTIEVHPLNKKEIAFSKEYKKVPILVDRNGHQVNDSGRIMRYLDSQYSQTPVFENDGITKEREDQWLQWADAVLVRSLPPLIYGTLGESLRSFGYITKVTKFSWFQRLLVRYSGAIVMKMVAKKSAKEQGITDPVAHFQNCLTTLQKEIGNKPFFGKARPNGVDIACFGILRSIENLNAFEYVKNEPKLYEWYQRIKNLTPMNPSVGQ